MRGMQLLEALLAEGVVRRPVGLVEGASGTVDRPLHFSGGGVGDLADDFLGGRVDVVEGLAGIGIDELAVDQHPLLGVDLH